VIIAHICVTGVPVLYQYGGAIQRRVFEISREQAKLGHKVIVYSIGYEKRISIIDGVELRYISCKSKSKMKSIEFQIRALADLKKATKNRVNILHFHSQPEGAILAIGFRAKKFLSYDNYYFRGIKKRCIRYYIYRALITKFTKLLPCSYYCFRESKSFWNIDQEKMQVIYNGVNTRQFNPDLKLREQERANLGVVGKHVILYVGRLCRQKGTHILIEAMSKIMNKRNDVMLVVAGPVEQFGKNIKSSVWPNLIKNIGGKYIGAVDEGRLPRVYNAADIFVMPTIELEMFGMAAIEAQACGKPVIASDHGGLREIITDKSGLRFSVGNAQELGEKIEFLIDNPDYYQFLSENAIKNASKYSWKNIAQALEELYQRT